MIGVIPTAGYATRVSSIIGGMQKGAVVVRWNGRELPMVCHQIDFLYNCGVEFVVLVIGYRAGDVVSAVNNYGYRGKVKFVVDTSITGLGNVWRTVARYFGKVVEEEGMISLNADDLMYEGTEDIVSKWVGRGYGIVFGVKREGLGKVKSTYELDDDGWVVRCVERGGTSEYVGCGMYYLVGAITHTRGNEPSDVINEMIDGGLAKFKFVDIKDWYDAGSVNGLAKIMVKR